jgi:5-methylcytosine-specific restriction endonuclease McrA
VGKKLRERIKMLFGGRCAYCGVELPDKWHVDHVEPVIRRFQPFYKNGRLVPTGEVFRPENEREDNLFPACIPCNIDKGTYDLNGWRRKLENSCDVLGNNSATYKHGVRFGVIVETRKSITFYFETLSTTPSAESGNG